MSAFSGHLDGLEDGWVLTGHVDAPGACPLAALDIQIDGRPAGVALANDPRNAPPGMSRLAFRFPLGPVWHDGAMHDIVVGEPASGQEIGRLSARIGIRRHYRDLPGFMAWLFHHRVLTAPFSDIDRICLGYLDWQADRMAETALPQIPGPPLVSIVMPCRNAAATLPAAIGSVLAQSMADWELIVVDDASQDDANRVLAGFEDNRICCLKLPANGGPSLARQYGLAQASGRFVAYLDADNWWDNRFLAAMSAQLAANPAWDAAFCGQYLHRRGAELPFAVRLGGYNPALTENENTIDINCLMHRREAGLACGGFDRELRRLEDWDFLLRLTADKAPLFVPAVLSHYAMSDDTAAQAELRDAAWQTIIGRRKSRPGAIALDDGSALWPDSAAERPRAVGVSIVIPSFEIADILALCVGRLMATIDPAKVEVIICDNGSGPAATARLSALWDQWPELRIEYLPENLGFTTAVNHGIRLARPDHHVVILNNDALVMEGWLEALLAVLEEHPDAGIVAPRQVLLPGTPTASAHAPACNTHLEIDVNLSAHHANVLASAPAYPSGVVELSFVPFFCVLLTRDLLDALGGLDERRGRHYRSDSLYCLAAREFAGKKIFYTPHAKVYHLLQQSSRALLAGDQAGAKEMLEANRWPGRREDWDI